MSQLQKTTQTQSEAGKSEPEKKKVTHFLVDPERVAQIPRSKAKDGYKTIGLGADHMQAFLVQNAGVNRNLAEFGRVSTHGPNAVADRTTLSIRHAAAALSQLVEAGFLVPQKSIEHESLPKLVKSTFEVDSKYPGRLAISHTFLRFEPGEKRAKLGTLKHLMQYIDDALGIPKSIARMDALQMYLALLAEQDFERYAGVDPALMGAPCPRESYSDCNRVHLPAGSAGFELLAVQVPKDLLFHPEFAQQVLSYLPSSHDVACVEDRAKLAFKNLRRSQLIYDTFVLWDGDPTADARKYEPSVIGTLHVGRGRDNNLEEHLEDAMDKFVRDLIVEAGNRYSPEIWRVYEPGSSIMRAVVQQHQSSRTCITKQIRVRNWAYDANNLGALEKDRERVQGEVSRLLKIRRRILDQN